MAGKRYLITGGLGFIGSALANNLDGSVTVLSRSDSHKDRLRHPSIKLLIKSLDQLDKEDVKDIDVIYHCASTVHNFNVLADPYIDIETNLKGTIRILELCKDLPKKPKIIYTSTFFVYGNEYDRAKKPINEESKTNPLGLYSSTKLCAESIIKLYSRIYGIPYIICRLTNVYGAEESFDNPKKGGLNFLAMRALKGEDIGLYNGGNFYRDYIYVDDVVDALMFLEDKANNDLFLVGYGEPVKFKDLVNYLLDNTGRKSKISDIIPPPIYQAVGVNNFVADVSKINSLGWRARINYTEGIKKILDFYKFVI